MTDFINNRSAQAGNADLLTPDARIPQMRQTASGLIAPLSFDEEPVKHIGEELAAEREANLAGVKRDAETYLRNGMDEADTISTIHLRRGADLGIDRAYIVETVRATVAKLAKRKP